MKILIIYLCLLSSAACAKTLFVCSGDINRCYISQVIATDFLYHPSEVKTLNEIAAPDENAIKILKAWNLEEIASIHRLDLQDIIDSDLILTMTEQDKNQIQKNYPKFSKKVFSLSMCANGKNEDIKTLKDKNFKTYEQTRNQIFGYEKIISVRGWRCHDLNR